MSTTKIELYGVIGIEVQASDIIAALQGAGDVELHIHSGGGHLHDGIAIYNRLREHTGSVTVVIDGLAASAASICAMAGDRIVMNESAMMMIHSPWLPSGGNADDMEQKASYLRKNGELMARIYRQRTGLSGEAVTALMRDETWLTAAEAVDLGFADDITAEGSAPEWHAAAAAYIEISTSRADLPAYSHPPEMVEPTKQPPASGGVTKEVAIMAESTDALQERIDALEAELASLREENATLTNSRDEVEHNAEARIRAMEDQLVLADLRAEGVAEEHHPHLVKLKREAPALFADSVAVLSGPTIQEPIGKPGAAVIAGTTGVAEILANAEKEGKTYGNGLGPWLAKNHPDRFNEVMAAARV